MVAVLDILPDEINTVPLRPFLAICYAKRVLLYGVHMRRGGIGVVNVFAQRPLGRQKDVWLLSGAPGRPEAACQRERWDCGAWQSAKLRRPR